jgi:hypothetical protein
MLELVIVYCLTANRSACIEQRSPIPSDLPMSCVLAGQQQGQDYVRWHPQYRMAGWRCEHNVPRQMPA